MSTGLVVWTNVCYLEVLGSRPISLITREAIMYS